ncbi:hypothetical protein G7Z17_g2431 [Cylindrodendrum hubeiense]|uniref:Integral membrane protein n=1 Tax=Cylindrodendrum hubeiense TaxID=595255 RepID=A0A9P5HHR6_9HYPO|nr:hypothetical protein G7Z17_g2431 [Cylindrodendrum hubeiense]
MASKIENRGPQLMVVNLTFLTAALISIVLRCYVRYFMVKAFGKDDWLMLVGTIFFTLNGADPNGHDGNTLDIAIWSTVEQGLAITAGSLATLRPLIKAAAFRLGLTSKPISLRPSDYGSSPRMPGPKSQTGFSAREAYTLSSIGRDEAVDVKKTGLNLSSSSDSKVGIRRETKWEVKVTNVERNESEEELRSPELWNKGPRQWNE